MDVKRIRRDFPILGSGIIYFDSAASSLTPEPVLGKMMEFYHEFRANVERGVYSLSQRASEEYEGARLKASKFINAESEREIVFTKNTTEGINTVAEGLKWRRGDKIVTTDIEHHSNFIVWLRVKQKYGAKIEIIKPNDRCLFDLDDFEKAIDDHTKIVAVTHLSNVLGIVVPVEEIAEIAHKHGALMLVDGAQSVPHIRTDVKKIGCDFLAFSGHKMCGPTGIGVLYMRGELMEEVEPLSIGGGSVKDVGIDYYTLADGPQKFEGGTPPIAEAIGLGAAIDYLNGIGMDEVKRHDEAVVGKLYRALDENLKVEVYGPGPEHRAGIVSFNVEGLSPHDVALALEAAAKIMVRSGAHCTLPLLKEVICHPVGTVRASAYIYSTEDEVDKLVEVISELASSLG